MSDTDLVHDRTLLKATGQPDELSPRVRRLIAPNPSPFTFTGTCTYIVGRGKLAIVDPGEGEGDWVRIKNLVEKPDPSKAPSRWAVAGRYAFSPIIFDMIRRVQPDKRGEIQITDAIQLLCEEGKRVLALKLPKQDKRYDIGNFPSYFETFVEFALADPLYGPDLKKRLRELLAE